MLETLEQVLRVAPVPPRRLNARIPRDLDTIALKCLEKNPSRRYASAVALADDLGRWLDGKPIVARPVSPIEHIWRWCRRRPAVARPRGRPDDDVLGRPLHSAPVWRGAEADRRRAELERDQAGRERSLAESSYQAGRATLIQFVQLLAKDVLGAADDPPDLPGSTRALNDSSHATSRARANSRDQLVSYLQNAANRAWNSRCYARMISKSGDRLPV